MLLSLVSCMLYLSYDSTRSFLFARYIYVNAIHDVATLCWLPWWCAMQRVAAVAKGTDIEGATKPGFMIEKLSHVRGRC